MKSAEDYRGESVSRTCLACGGSGVFRSFAAREMMFGRRDSFAYGECPACGSIQIERVPENLADYYPSDYYSLASAPSRSKQAPWTKRALAGWLVGSRSGVAERAARRIYRKSPFFVWARLTGAQLDTRFLDVGSGAGGLLQRMRRYGFNDLTGVDPYLKQPAEEPGFRLWRGELESVAGRFDVIMFHHVLEHVADPVRTLEAARGRLAPGGCVLVRLPVAGSYACREYREHWYSLDPPRHLSIPSVKGMNALAARAGFRIAHTGFDSNESSLLMSENYRRDVPMTGAPEASPAEQARARAKAEQLNRDGDGDWGLYVLRPAD